MKTVNENMIEKLEQQARSQPQNIAFPESGNEMILRAAAEVVARGIGYPWLIGNRTAIEAAAASSGVSARGFMFFDNTDEEAVGQLAQEYLARFDDLSEKSVRRKAKDPVNCAMFLLKLGKVDGVAAGRDYTTADVIIAAQAIVGLKEGFNTVSSVGIVNAPGFEGPEGSMLVIADCAINPTPDAGGLADIAIASADTAAMLLGWEPRVAMLAFSTCGSSEHESIDVIRTAIDMVRERRPELKIDGEFQLDSAILPKTAEKKVKRDSAVAGKGNVLIFPNLHAGNIGVKLIQTFGKADAYGPVLQGFAKPVCDFSRSAPLSEMMGNIMMLIVRAQKEKQ
jgi:phosphate acetyltransferase